MEPIGFQVVVDCVDPHAQARFWAAALGYDLEVRTEFVQGLLDQGIVGDDDVVRIDGDLFFRMGAAITHPGTGQRLLFMAVPEHKAVKNRLHLDLNVGKVDRTRIDVEVARLEGLGARTLYRIDEPGAFHTTMADPEGNEFCVH